MGKNRVIIVTDTTACLPQDLAQQLEIEVVPVILVFGKQSFRDGIDITNAQFYEKLRTADQLPTTSGGLTAPFLEAFTRAAGKAGSILCLNLSSKLSSMANAARMARDMARLTLPQVKIEIIDTGTAAGAQGLIVTAAARVAQGGGTLEDVTRTVQDLIPKSHLYAMLDTLHYLVKGGRAPRAAEIATSLLQIKPIIGVIDGVAKPVENCLTVQTAMRHLLRIVEQKMVKGAPLHLVVMHAGAPERGQKLLMMANNKFQTVENGLWEFTPVIGVHTGPGLVGVAFYCE